MKTAVFASLIAGAAAFAPAKTAQSSTALAAAFGEEIGVQAPLNFGGEPWDPLGLLNGADQARFDRLRYVEVKHGRIAMLAVVGHITTSSGYRLAGDIDFSGTSFASIKTGLAGLSDIPLAGVVQIIAFIGFLEIFIMKDVKGTAEFPGDFTQEIHDFGWDRFTDEEKATKRAIELNQGRAAQMGILGLMVHEKLGGDPYIVNSLLGHPAVFN